MATQQHVLSIAIADRGAVLKLAGILTDLMIPAPDAVSVFESDGSWRIDAHFCTLPSEGCAPYVARAAEFAGLSEVQADWTALPDTNWVALVQAGLPPVASRLFTVHGSHDADKIGRRRFVIEIDAGEAFGTAHHATTYGCLEAIARHALAFAPTRVRRVLDLGAGSGILAIAAARVWPNAEIIASDRDVDAVHVAQQNVVKNGAKHHVSVARADGIPQQSRMCGTHRTGPLFDLIIANILAAPLVRLAPQVTPAVAPGGFVILSGILNEQARSVAASYLSRGLQLSHHARIEGWSTLVLQRRR